MQGKIEYITRIFNPFRYQMPSKEKRSSERISYEAPVVIENSDTGRRYDGTMYNYSRDGMYFEIDSALKPGTQIVIVVKLSGSAPGPIRYHAKVRWCEEILGAVVLYNFGIGAEYDFLVKPPISTHKFKVIQGGASQASSSKEPTSKT